MLNRFDYRLVRQLLLFAVIVEEKSLRNAARRLNMSQPPLKAQIDELEARLRIKLLERSPRGVKGCAASSPFRPSSHSPRLMPSPGPSRPITWLE